jgi:hypothetical protein
MPIANTSPAALAEVVEMSTEPAFRGIDLPWDGSWCYLLRAVLNASHDRPGTSSPRRVGVATTDRLLLPVGNIAPVTASRGWSDRTLRDRTWWIMNRRTSGDPTNALGALPRRSTSSRPM